jgi:hypothetical protein
MGRIADLSQQVEMHGHDIGRAKSCPKDLGFLPAHQGKPPTPGSVAGLRLTHR